MILASGLVDRGQKTVREWSVESSSGHPSVLCHLPIEFISTEFNYLRKGRNGERYLLGAANWNFEKFFGRLERLTKIPAPKLALPAKLMVTGSQIVENE